MLDPIPALKGAWWGGNPGQDASPSRGCRPTLMLTSEGQFGVNTQCMKCVNYSFFKIRQLLFSFQGLFLTLGISQLRMQEDREVLVQTHQNAKSSDSKSGAEVELG